MSSLIWTIGALVQAPRHSTSVSVNSPSAVVNASQPWKTELVDYPHALVRLNFCKVYAWTGPLEMRESQQYSWQRLPVQVGPVLPGTVPVLTWFAEESNFEGATYLVVNYALR